MRMLKSARGTYGNVRNNYTRGSFRLTPVPEKLVGNRFGWYGLVSRRPSHNTIGKVLDMRLGGAETRMIPVNHQDGLPTIHCSQ